MLIERPPLIYRMFFPECVWRLPQKRPTVYLTFDDGPIPEVTPWVLETLQKYGVRATFFMVGENAWRHPTLLEEVRRQGHVIGNHSYNHLQGMKVSTLQYMRNIEKANRLLQTTLYRPPHGLLKWEQARLIKQSYKIIMYDVVTRDYDRSLSPERILRNVMRYSRNGSIIVFHDSLKSEKNIRWALPRAIEWLKEQGYEFGVLKED